MSKLIPQKKSLLADTEIKKNVISTNAIKLRVVDRFPKSGMPAAGSPITLGIEIQSNINANGYFFRLPFVCPDATIIVRNSFGEMIGHKFITTRWTNSCTGSDTITLNASYRPSQNNPVIIEAYQGEVDVYNLKNAELIGKSQPVDLSYGIEQGRNIGVYGEGKNQGLESLVSGANLANIEGLTRNVLLLALLGGGLYLTAPLLPIVKSKIKSLAT